jgi:hypothetical protein
VSIRSFARARLGGEELVSSGDGRVVASKSLRVATARIFVTMMGILSLVIDRPDDATVFGHTE